MILNECLNKYKIMNYIFPSVLKGIKTKSFLGELSPKIPSQEFFPFYITLVLIERLAPCGRNTTQYCI